MSETKPPTQRVVTTPALNCHWEAAATCWPEELSVRVVAMAYTSSPWWNELAGVTTRVAPLTPWVSVTRPLCMAWMAKVTLVTVVGLIWSPSDAETVVVSAAVIELRGGCRLAAGSTAQPGVPSLG